MIENEFDVVAIGNAIVDVLAKVDEHFIAENNLQKGGMVLIDEKQAEAVYNAMPPSIEKSGGSSANTIAGIVSLGGNAAFIGKVKNDQLGKIFIHDLRAQGVHYTTQAATDGISTARCLVAVTPDAERSMATYLGATKNISKSDIDEEIIANSKVIYLEGYLWDEQNAKDAMREAVRLAVKHGREIALSLSDAFCVTRHRAELLELISQNVDILFANEAEIKELLDVDSVEDAVIQLSSMCKVSAITLGGKGSVIVADNKIYTVPPKRGIKLVDTTGAGDLYAAGFLFGYTQGHLLAECGRIATIAASEIIQHIGARPEVSLAELL
jgi:sugar/nucleoside kinase (ribokinase family)